MNFGRIIATAVTICLPFAASAASVGGTFTEGGAINPLSAGGVQGNANVITEGGEGNETYSWTFRALEDLVVSGFGTVNFDFQFANLSYIYNGNSVPVMPGNPGASTVQFPELALNKDDEFAVSIAFDSASQGGDADFALRTRSIAPVPVPAAGLLLLGGLAGFAGLRRKAG